jgi:hypothetical protein
VKKVSFLEVSQLRPAPVDWPLVLQQLSHAGVSTALLASMLSRYPSTIENWKYRGGKPRYDDGATILAMHEALCKKR